MWRLLILVLSGSIPAQGASLEEALAAERAGDDRRALEIVDALVRGSPTEPLVRLEAGRLRLKGAVDLDRAELDLDVARALAPENARAQYLWGLLREERGDERGALQAWETAVLYRPDWTEPRFRLAGLYFAEGRWADAERHYRALATLEPGAPGPRLQLAAVLERQGRPDEAIPVLEALWSEGVRAAGMRLEALYEQVGRRSDAQRIRASLAGETERKKMRPLGPSRR